MTFPCIPPLRDWWRGLFADRWLYDRACAERFPDLRHLDQLTICELWAFKQELTHVYAISEIDEWQYVGLYDLVCDAERHWFRRQIWVERLKLFHDVLASLRTFFGPKDRT